MFIIEYQISPTLALFQRWAIRNPSPLLSLSTTSCGGLRCPVISHLLPLFNLSPSLLSFTPLSLLRSNRLSPFLSVSQTESLHHPFPLSPLISNHLSPSQISIFTSPSSTSHLCLLSPLYGVWTWDSCFFNHQSLKFLRSFFRWLGPYSLLFILWRLCCFLELVCYYNLLWLLLL